MSDLKKPDYNYFIPALKRNEQLNLLQVGWERCKPKYKFVNMRDLYLVHYINSGKGTIEVNNQTFTLKKNHCFIYRANELLVMTADEEDPWEISFFAFDGSLAEKIIETTVFKDGQISYCFENGSELCNFTTKFLSTVEKNSFTVFSSLQVLFELLNYIADDNNNNDNNNYNNTSYSSKNEKRYFNIAREYIVQNYTRKITVSDLASYVKLNRTYLFKLFKKYSGKSIDDYIITLRINEAKRYLHETNMSILNISQAVGYDNYSAFYKMFERETGLSPYKYRKTLK